MSIKDTLKGWLQPPPKVAPGLGAIGSADGATLFLPGAEAHLHEPPVARVLVAAFDGAEGMAVADHVAEALQAGGDIVLGGRPRKLRLVPGATALSGLLAVAEQGLETLRREKADLLVWGDAGTESVTVRFLPAVLSADGGAGWFGIGEYLELPLQFGNDLAQAVRAMALAAALPGRPGPKERAIQVLGRALDDVNWLVGAPPPGLNAEQGTSLGVGLGLGFAAYWRLSGEPERLDRAITAFRGALERGSAKTTPLIWGLGQNHLAVCLEALGERNPDDPVPLDQAAAAYRGVIEALDRATYPNDWALAQSRLAGLLYRQGLKRHEPALLRSAAQTYEAALGVYSPDTQPMRWANVCNHEGVVLMALGAYSDGIKILEKSVDCFRRALTIRTRDVSAQLWAQTMNNLGAACFSLGKRTDDAEQLHEAVACFEGAREVYREMGSERTVRVIEKNLGRVHSLLGERKGGR